MISMIRKNDYLRDKNPVCIPIGQTVSMVAERYLKIQLKKRGLKMRKELICCIPSPDARDKNGVPGAEETQADGFVAESLQITPLLQENFFQKPCQVQTCCRWPLFFVLCC